MTILPELIEEVSQKVKFAPAGEDTPRPIPRRFDDAVRFMQRPRYVRSTAFRDLRWRIPYGDCDGDIRRFCLRLLDEAAAHMIPLRVHVYDRSVRSVPFACEWLREDCSPLDDHHGEAVHGRLVMIEHALLGRDLPRMCWDVIGELGRTAARRIEARLLVTGFGIDHPWMVQLAESERAVQPGEAWDEFKRLERQWYRRFDRRGVGG